MILLENNRLSKILIVVLVFPVLSMFLSNCIGALFFSQFIEPAQRSASVVSSMVSDFIGAFCGLFVCYKIWPRNNSHQFKSESKQVTVALVFLIWLINGYNMITTQEFKSDMFWAFISGGLGGLFFILISFPGIVLLGCVPIFLFRNKSLQNFNWWSKINIGLFLGTIFSFCLLFVCTMNKQ